MANILVAHRDTLASPDATQTSGMHRLTGALGDTTQAVEVRTSPESVSGWHHHGDYTTIGYVISGRLRFEWGPGGKEIAEAGPGEFFMVPPHTIHREGNPGRDEQKLAGFRLGTGPTVFNVEGPEAG